MIASSSKTLSRRVEEAETIFWESLTDQESLSAFRFPWATLSSDLIRDIDHLDSETKVATYATASRVATIAEALSDVYTEIGALDMSLDSELGRILDSIYPVSEARITQPDALKYPRDLEQDKIHQSPATRGPALPSSNRTCSKLSAPGVHYKWLLENLHCPFPTWRVKKELLKSLDLTPRSLDDWFSTARRKIGWIAFSKRHFKGNRCVTTDCTDHVLVKGKRDDKYSEEILRDLDEIKDKAERLYGSADGDGSSSFAKELEGIEVQATVGSKSRRKQSQSQSASSTSTNQSSSPSPSTSSSSSRKRSFAKESEGIEAQTTTVGSRSRRKQRISTSSTTTNQSSSPSPSTSSSSSRKRSRASSEESDTTCYSESSESDSHRASKRLRSISPTFSCTSQESSSSSTSSSDSSDTISEIHTPRISPAHPNFPVEIVDVDDWIDDISASASASQRNFLPDDADADAFYKPRSILSQKRVSPDDSESDVRTKRARVDGPWPVPYEKSDSPIAESRPNDLGAQAGSTQPSPSSEPSPSATEEPAGAGAVVSPMYDTTATVLQPSSELDEETMDFFLSQMDFNIPQAPIPEWDENVLRGVEVEVSQFDFASVGLGYGSGVGFEVEDDTYDTSSVLSYPSDSCSPLPASGLLSKLHAHVPERVEATNTPNSTSTSTSSSSNPTSNTDDQSIQRTQSIQSIISESEYFASTPLILTSKELEFLESIGNTTQSPSPSTSSSLPLILSSTGVKNSAVDMVQDGKSASTKSTSLTPVPLVDIDIDVVHSSDDDTERTSSDDSENVGTSRSQSQSQFIDRFVFV